MNRMSILWAVGALLVLAGGEWASAIAPARGGTNAGTTVQAGKTMGDLGGASWKLMNGAAWVNVGKGEPPAIQLTARSNPGAGVPAARSSNIALPSATKYVRVTASIKTRGIDELDVSYNAALFVNYLDKSPNHWPVRREMVGFAQGTQDWHTITRIIAVPSTNAGLIGLEFTLSKTQHGRAWLRDVRVESASAPTVERPVNLVVTTVRMGDAPVITFPHESKKFVLSNLFGDKLDTTIGFSIKATSKTIDVAGAKVECAILDPDSEVLWRSSGVTLKDGQALLEVKRTSARLPLDEYLRFETRILGADGKVVATDLLPFGILSQDGNMADLPVPNSVNTSQLDSPFGMIPSNLGRDRGMAGFGEKSLYTSRMSGAQWYRAYMQWEQPTPDAPINDWGERQLGQLRKTYNFQTLVSLFGYPSWTNNAPGARGSGTNLGNIDALRAYIKWRCAPDRTPVGDYVQFFNEPPFNDPKLVEHQVKVFAAAVEELHKYDPDAKIVSSGYNATKVPLENYLKAGIAKYVDIFDIHSYARSVSQMEQWMKEQQQLVRQYAPGKPMWATEIAPRWTNNIPRRQMSDWVIKTYAIGMAHGFTKLFWFGYRPTTFYEWDASLYDEDDRVTPRPAWFSYRTMVRHLEGRKFIREMDVGGGARAFLFTGADGSTIVTWRIHADQQPIIIPIQPQPGQTYTASGYLGKARPVTVGNTSISVVAPHPVFISGPKFD